LGENIHIMDLINVQIW